MDHTEPTLMGRALPAALRMLTLARTCCVLSVEAEEGTATIALAKGKVAWATTDSTQRLGEQLVAKGFVEREMLDRVLSIQQRKRTRNPICTILCELGLLSPEVAGAEIAAQTTEAMTEMLGWGRGTLRVESLDPSESDTTISIDQQVETLLVRVALLREGFGEATREISGDGTVVVHYAVSGPN